MNFRDTLPKSACSLAVCTIILPTGFIWSTIIECIPDFSYFLGLGRVVMAEFVKLNYAISVFFRYICGGVCKNKLRHKQ